MDYSNLLLLSTVEEAFELSGRSSVVVVPGIPRHGDFNWKPTIGNIIILERPDGTTLQTVIGGLEMLSPPNPDFIPFMLGAGVTKQMVPAGTKLWVDYATAV